MGDANALTQLAALQALYKRLGEILSTKDPTSLRGQVDYRLKELYEQAGVDRLRIMYDDVELGKLVVKVSKPTKRTNLFVNDFEALLDGSSELVNDYVREHHKDFACWVFETTGAVPDGCELSVEEVPGGFAGTTLTGCKPEQVLPMLGIGRVAGYLEEG